MKILVAMSGGVDSSVVAHMLQREGHELIGVMMKLWTDPLAPTVRRALPTKCCSVEHIRRARAVCNDLGIPFYVLNLENEFKQNVVDPFIESYRKGDTPNPCIECNRTIKFGKLLETMKELGCEKLATGHYARIAEETLSDGSVRMLLLEALDAAKDQSYYLYSLSQDALRHVLFPLGALTKDETYAKAESFGIGLTDTYRESQDLCFFPERNPEEFLKRYIPDAAPGDIRTLDGNVVGKHKGLPFYTIGQRRGLGIGGLKIPLHVVSKERASNTVFVAPTGADRNSTLKASNLRWISWSPKEGEQTPFEARIYSMGRRHAGVATHNGSSMTFEFEKPVAGIAPGQSIVLYRGKEVIGGGVIA